MIAKVYPPTCCQVVQVEHFQHKRPLDRFIVPALRALTQKTSIYDEPANDEDRAILLLERAKEAKTPAVREDYLHRCVLSRWTPICLQEKGILDRDVSNFEIYSLRSLHI